MTLEGVDIHEVSSERGTAVTLREYLYVDSAVVRGLLAQMDSGIVETEQQTTSKAKKTGGGVKGFAEHVQDWGDSRTTTKALGDTLFPILEESLEAEGLLEDVSDVLASGEEWAGGDMHDRLPPGKIVRITLPGYLIDARFVASFLSGFAVTHRGLVNMGVLPQATEAVLPPKAKQASKKKPYKELPGEAESLEGAIPLGRILFDEESDSDSNISGEFFRGITQVTRGMFAPGLHLVLASDAEKAGSVTIRLQEGRQFLDTDPDILFARYGVGAQEWTVVGTVGHHPDPSASLDNPDFMTADDDIARGKFGRYVNQLGSVLGNLGFTDLPQAPGFSVIPWGVYRTLGVPRPPEDGDLFT